VASLQNSETGPLYVWVNGRWVIAGKWVHESS
jgi:hypothetical protein